MQGVGGISIDSEGYVPADLRTDGYLCCGRWTYSLANDLRTKCTV